MAGSLSSIAEYHGIPFIRDFGVLPISAEEYPDEKIFRLIDRFAAAYGDELVLYGGLTACERIFGLKRIRGVSTDLDFVCTRAGLDAVIANERLWYHSVFDIFFSVAENIPVSFAFGHIHDWTVTADFFGSALPAQLTFPSAASVRCASREYGIMLKLRRMNERLECGYRPFGKDALDIMNTLTAPSFRKDLEPVDLARLRDLVLSETTADKASLRALLGFIAEYAMHLTCKEGAAFLGVLSSLERMLEERRQPGAG